MDCDHKSLIAWALSICAILGAVASLAGATGIVPIEQTLDYIGAFEVQDNGTIFWPAVAGRRTANETLKTWSTDYTANVTPRDYTGVSAIDAGYGSSLTFTTPSGSRTMSKSEIVRGLLTRYGQQQAFYSRYTDSTARTPVNDTTVSAALQMAIWEVKYDNGQGWTSGRELLTMHSGEIYNGLEVAAVDRGDNRLSTVDGTFGGQFAETSYGDLRTEAAYNPPYSDLGPGGAHDGGMSTMYAHLWLRDVVNNPVSDPLVDIGFLEAYDPVTGGFTDGQGLIAVVPEPLTVLGFCFGGASLAGYIRKRLKK